MWNCFATGEAVHSSDNLIAPCLDTRPPLQLGQPEQRSYRMRHLDRNDPTGGHSDVVTVP